MKVLVTGSKGFIGSNLVLNLKQHENIEVLTFDIENTQSQLDSFIKQADFIFHIAGVNRPKHDSQFIQGNYDLTQNIIDLHKKYGKKSPILLSSSVQATEDNEYGKSKRAAEKALETYSKNSGVIAYIYRLTNVFGKWSKPNYNSVVATFCHNIARNIPIEIHNPKTTLNLIYIDDIVKSFISLLSGTQRTDSNSYKTVKPEYAITLEELANSIKSFKNSKENIYVPKVADEFTKKLYSTYLSYLPKEYFTYELTTHSDQRGLFAELFRSTDSGQVSINISKPGITKGNHWHNTKVEKFVVVSGNAKLQFRKPNTNQVIEYTVSGKDLKVVDIVPGYTHNIINIGDDDLITVIWANECFDEQNPDTYFLEV